MFHSERDHTNPRLREKPLTFSLCVRTIAKTKNKVALMFSPNAKRQSALSMLSMSRLMPGKFGRLVVSLFAAAVTFFGPAATEEAFAGGFRITPLVAQAGQPFTFDIGMAGLEGPDGLYVEGSER